ncbi:MAG: PEP-CTERM sorting domain-containing protein [Armatimonadota bacterium]
MPIQGHNNATGRDDDFHCDNPQAVPEPASMAAIGLGILGLARRRKANKA